MEDDKRLWWETPPEDVHLPIFRYVRGVEETQFGIHDANNRHAWFYDRTHLNGYAFQSHQTPWNEQNSQVVENVTQSVVDTVTSMVGKNRPKATFLTDGAEWKMQRKAKELEHFVEAEFHRTALYEHVPYVFRDGCVFGDGFLKIFEDPNEPRIAIERVISDEIIVDEKEARLSQPRQMHQRRFVDKYVLKQLYKKKHEEIDRSIASERPWTTFLDVPNEQVVVLESWHLPSHPGASDGRHVISVSGGVLLYEKFSEPEFPFARISWSPRLTGFFARGLVEDMMGSQLRINKINKFIARCQDLVAVPRIFAHISDVNLKQKVTNDIGHFVFYRSKEPRVDVPQAVPPEIYRYKEQLKQSMYQMAGISELSSQSKKPVGIDSAVALREFNNIETERFAIQAQALENFYLDCARRFVRVQKKIGGGKKSPAVWKSRNLVKRIDWDDVNMDEDQYAMSIEASSILSRTPSGRLQQVVELAQTGALEPAEIRRLLGHPDVTRSMDLENAALDDIERTIEQLIDGEAPVPEPQQSLELGMKLINFAYLKVKDDNAPEDIRDGFLRWLVAAQGILDKAQQAAPPPAPIVPFQAGLPTPAGPTAAPPPGAMPGGPMQPGPAAPPPPMPPQ